MAVEVWGITAFTVVSYVCGYLAALLAATCFATSLFFLSDLAEDNPGPTRQLVRTYSYGVVAVLVVLYLFDDFTLTSVAIGVCAHAWYASFAGPAFPEVANGPKLWGGIALFLVDCANWYYYFADNWSYGTAETLGFCLACSWVVPLALFVSLYIGGGLPTRLDGAAGSSAPSGALHGSGGGFSLRRLFGHFAFGQKKQSLLPTHHATGNGASGSGSGSSGDGFDESGRPLMAHHRDGASDGSSVTEMVGGISGAKDS